MSSYMKSSEIERVFEGMGISPIERDIQQLRDLMNPEVVSDRRGAVYKTVLANGTGQLLRTDKTDAKLERDAI